VLVHHVVDEIARGDGKGEAAEAVDDHEQKAAKDQPTTRFDQLPDLGENFFEGRLGA